MISSNVDSLTVSGAEVAGTAGDNADAIASLNQRLDNFDLKLLDTVTSDDHTNHSVILEAIKVIPSLFACVLTVVRTTWRATTQSSNHYPRMCTQTALL